MYWSKGEIQGKLVNAAMQTNMAAKQQSQWIKIITKTKLQKNEIFFSLVWALQICFRSLLAYVRRTVQLKAFTDSGFCKTVPGVELWVRRPSTAQVHHQHALTQPFPLFSSARTNLLFLAAGALTVGGCVLFCHLRSFWCVLRFYADT